MTDQRIDFAATAAPGHLWMTQIQEAQITGTSTLEYKLNRPSSGTATGGFTTLWKDSIEGEGESVERVSVEGQDSGKFKLTTKKVDLTVGVYILGYGPHYAVNNTIIATSAFCANGRFINYDLSMCSPISSTVNSVTSYYVYDDNPLGYASNAAYIIVREGGTFGEGKEIGRRLLHRNAPFEGVAHVKDLKLNPGATYNVTSTLYSSVRPVAGYAFTRPK